MSRLLMYHVYLPDYDIQGETHTTEKPLDKQQKQQMLDEFFDWIAKGKGGQNASEGMKRSIAKGHSRLVFDGGHGQRANVWVDRISQKYGFDVPEGLTEDEYKRIYRGKWTRKKSGNYHIQRDNKGRFKKWYKFKEVRR